MLGNFRFLRFQTPSSDAEISWIACRHIPHPLILVAFVSVISYFQLPACSADPNEPRSRGRSVGQVNALSSSLAVISLSNLEMGRVRISYLPSGNCFSPVLYLSPGGHFVQTNNPPKPAKAAASPSARLWLLSRYFYCLDAQDSGMRCRGRSTFCHFWWSFSPWS